MAPHLGSFWVYLPAISFGCVLLFPHSWLGDWFHALLADLWLLFLPISWEFLPRTTKYTCRMETPVTETYHANRKSNEFHMISLAFFGTVKHVIIRVWNVLTRWLKYDILLSSPSVLRKDCTSKSAALIPGDGLGGTASRKVLLTVFRLLQRRFLHIPNWAGMAAKCLTNAYVWQHSWPSGFPSDVSWRPVPEVDSLHGASKANAERPPNVQTNIEAKPQVLTAQLKAESHQYLISQVASFKLPAAFRVTSRGKYDASDPIIIYIYM